MLRICAGRIWVCSGVSSAAEQLDCAESDRARRCKAAAEPWLKDVAPESFVCAHTVIDVAPDGKTYTLMLVDARDEKRTVLGAYDFETATRLGDVK